MSIQLREIRVAATEASDWRPRNEYLFKLARLLHVAAPRGKGWLPRQIGRIAGDRLRAEIRTASGGRLIVDPNSLEVFAFIEANGGLWEGHDIATCLALLDLGQVFYDIGANAGLFSIEVAAAFGGRIDVRAFEPQPSLARSLALSVARNGFESVHVYPVMLGEHEGDARIFVPASSVHASIVARSSDARVLSCQQTTLDALVDQATLPPPDVIKLDVEGAELSVIRGGLATLSRYEPALVFESDVNQARFGYTRADLCRELRSSAPYRFFAVERDGGYTALDGNGAGPIRRADSVLAVSANRFDPARLGL